MSNDGFMEFGFGENDLSLSRKSRRFRAEKDNTYRISFAWWAKNEDGTPNFESDTPRFIGAPRLWFDKIGNVIANNPEIVKLHPGEGKVRKSLATIIVLWPTNRSGDIDKTRLREGDFDVIPWLFNEKSYEMIKPLHRDFHFGKNDLALSCTDTQFQTLNFRPIPGSLLYSMANNESSKEVYNKILSEVAEVEKTIRDEVGQVFTPDELRRKLGTGSVSILTPTKAAAAAVSEDLDNMLDDILV